MKTESRPETAPIIWSETTEEMYMEMLEVLPPAMWLGGDFLVGEPWDHDPVSGHPRFAGFREQGGKFYNANRPMTHFEFKVERAIPIKIEGKLKSWTEKP